MRSGWRKGLRIGGSVFATAFVAIGALHMPFAKSLLMKIGDCPIRATPSQVEAFIAEQTKATRGTAIAPARPALGFAFEQTKPDDVLAWAKTNNLDCSGQRSQTIVLCSNVPSAFIGEIGGPVEEVQFDFRTDTHTLRIVSTFRRQLSKPDAAHILDVIDTKIAKDLGPPPEVHGSANLEGKRGGYVESYNYKDYLASTSAQNLGAQGFAIAEHYVSQVD